MESQSGVPAKSGFGNFGVSGYLDRAKLSATPFELLRQLHDGSFCGNFTKVLSVLVRVTPSLLFLNGLLM